MNTLLNISYILLLISKIEGIELDEIVVNLDI